MISLDLSFISTWERARIKVQKNFSDLQDILNAQLGRVFTPSGQLQPGTIPGDGSTPRYVANTGTNNSLKLDQIDLAGTGIVNSLPYSHLPQVVHEVDTDDIYVSGGPVTTTGTIAATPYAAGTIDSASHALCGGL